MTGFGKIIGWVCLVFGALLPAAAVAHFAIFPQQTKSLLIAYSSFKKDGCFYYNSATPSGKIDNLKAVAMQASTRVANFWGARISSPKIIYCDTPADFATYCANPTAPAVTYLKLGTVIVLSRDAANVDIVAHELSHAELYARIGGYQFDAKIPSWFKHGLAMQNDYRNYYSEDTLRAKTNNFNNLPAIKNMQSDEQFYAGSPQQVMLNYMAAKHEVKNWYTPEKLRVFIEKLNAGETFAQAYIK